ncbi:MAG TPA: Hsp20/alpha crystallin family protein [Thermoclostridium sp.]|nr:Hsp20/alpha crystallin family protein [Clostridiaceae bacterium]HOQ75375.1 Hsp20/alpha crystallin family protein [Thermoclostridium sp.]HPU44647.1 Hsp20/alpha crystallin family protein [Thermoclostridium sp.]
MFSLIPFSRRNSDVSRRDDFFGIDRFFNDFFRDPFFSRFSPFASPIRADVKENDREYIVEAEMPGVRKEDISIEISDDVLTLGVDTKKEVNEESEGYIYRERSTGSFKRSFHIQNIKHDEIKASYKDGILTIELPKDDKAKGSKKISID